jgi:hypothetical protein
VHCVPTFSNGEGGLLNGSVNPVFRLIWMGRKHIRYRLKAKQHRIEALQHCVMQFTRDARSFGKSLLEPRVQLARKLNASQSHDEYDAQQN